MMISKIIVFGLLTTCLIRSFGEVVFFPTWLDEFLAVLFFCYCACIGRVSFKNKGNDFEKSVVATVLFVVLGVFTAFSHQITEVSIGYDLFDILKYPVFFLLLSSVKIDEKMLLWIKKTYIILNIPSIFFGLFQWFMANYRGVYIGLSIYRDRTLGARINGFAGHNIALGFAMMINLIFLLEVSQKKWWHWVLIVGSSGCLLFAQSRIPILLTILYILYKYVYLKARSMARPIIFLLAAIVLVVAFWGIAAEAKSYSQSEENTIRYMTIMKGGEVLSDYPIAGYGFGSYGTVESIKQMSPFYGAYPDEAAKKTIAKGTTREAFAFQIIIETGLLGFVLYYYSFFASAFNAMRRKNYDLFYIILFAFILQSFMNGVYQMPVFFIMCFMEGASKHVLIGTRQETNAAFDC